MRGTLLLCDALAGDIQPKHGQDDPVLRNNVRGNVVSHDRDIVQIQIGIIREALNALGDGLRPPRGREALDPPDMKQGLPIQQDRHRSPGSVSDRCGWRMGLNRFNRPGHEGENPEQGDH